MKKILVNGNFDKLKFEDIELFESLKSYKDSYLFLLLNSDKLLHELKIPSTENNEYRRAYCLSSIKYIDKLDICDSYKDLLIHIKEFKPTIIVTNIKQLNQHYSEYIKFYGC